MGILDSVGDISKILADLEAGRAKGRLDQGDAQQRQANAAANIYRTQADVALKGPLQSAKAAAQGDQMANIQPFSWTGGTAMSGNIPIPQSAGGLTPANFGPATRRAGADLATLSADRVSSPDFNMPHPPVLPPLPESSGLDSILGSASTLGSLASALGKAASGGNIKDLIDKIRGRGRSNTNGNTGNRAGDFGNWLDNPPDDNGYSRDAGGNYGPDPNVSTDEFVGMWPEQGGAGDSSNPVDPSQMPGHVDPMQEYLDWLARQNGSGSGDTGNPDEWTDPSVWGG